MRGGVGGAAEVTYPNSAVIGTGGGAGGGGFKAGGGGGGDGLGPLAGGGHSGGGGGGSGFIAFERALPATGRLLTAAQQAVPNAEEAGGAGRGGDGRDPWGAWLRRDARSEATSGRPGLVVIVTGEP